MRSSPRPADWPHRLKRWLAWEQTVNEQIDRDADGRLRILLHSRRLKPKYRPDRQPDWGQEVIWLPHKLARSYGPVSREVELAFRCKPPANRVPFFLHPQTPAAHRRLKKAYGSIEVEAVRASPTSSYRTVVAWRGRRRPVSLKLSLGAVVSGIRRVLLERDLASALVISRLLDTIPLPIREQIGFDWFPETAGVAEVASGTGWLLRRFPRTFPAQRNTTMIPAFSLISRRGEMVPILVEMIRTSGRNPEEFVLEKIVRPYVRVLAHLLLEEGIQVEGHTQNILFEMNDAETLCGRVFLRDLSDMSVSLAHRIARKRPLPALEALRPKGAEGAPFALATSAADHHCGQTASALGRAGTTVERFGLRGFIWSINTSLIRFFPRFKTRAIECEYLTLWRSEAQRYLHVRPQLRTDRVGIRIDEAIATYLRERWGAPKRHRLPKGAEPLTRGKGSHSAVSASVLGRVESAWGDLFLSEGVPAYFYPAF